MKVFKRMLMVLIIINIIGILILMGIFFVKFSGGFSQNPEHWYAAGSFLVGFLSLLVTIIIAIYVSELTKQTTKFPEQKRIQSELAIIMQDVFEIFNGDSYIMQFNHKIFSIIRRLYVLKDESFIFNDVELYESAVVRYNDKLQEIERKVSMAYYENLHKYSHTDDFKIGRIHLTQIDSKLHSFLNIREEEKYLKDSIIKAMK